MKKNAKDLKDGDTVLFCLNTEFGRFVYEGTVIGKIVNGRLWIRYHNGPYVIDTKPIKLEDIIFVFDESGSFAKIKYYSGRGFLLE